MQTKHIFAIVIASGFSLLGCDEKTTSEGDTIVCTAVIAPALQVSVFDKETGFPNACGATVIFEDGDFYEEHIYEQNESCNESYTFSGADEREGIYNVTVKKEGYMEWQQFDVEVSSNLCHVNTISLQAYLEK
jgi:hypothetical protein